MLKFILALCAGKCISAAIHILGPILHKNGTHLPGNIALKIDPLFLKHIGRPKTIVAVTGTNGKTTTNNLIIDALEKNGYKVLSNRYGSNVNSGICSIGRNTSWPYWKWMNAVRCGSTNMCIRTMSSSRT